MPVRSINLKLIVPRSEHGQSLRRSLWTTHDKVNAATRYYEQQLLNLRAASYESVTTEEKRFVSQEEAEATALAAAREAQRANMERADAAGNQPGSNAKIVAAVQSLYRLLVPAETGAGSAQDANGYLSPLTDPASRGFGAAAEKLERPRPNNWLAMPDDDPGLLEVANKWLASETSAAWRSDTGSPAGWLRAARTGKADWPGLFRRKIDELERKTADGPEAVVAHLRSLRLLPLFPPYFSPRVAKGYRRCDALGPTCVPPRCRSPGLLGSLVPQGCRAAQPAGRCRG